MGSKEKPPDGGRDHDAEERETAWAAGLKAKYDEVTEEQLPEKLRELLERIETMRWGQGRSICQAGGGRRSATPTSLAAIVDAYIAEYRDDARRELQFYGRQRSRAQAVERAALSKLPGGKRHPHQRRIPAAKLEEAARRLAGANYSAIASFDALHALVESTISPINGIGTLAVYDIAHRVGAYLGHAPARVYLHSGALTGARTLGLSGKVIEASTLPRPFRRLTPAEIEDCLCVYKDELKRLRLR